MAQKGETRVVLRIDAFNRQTETLAMELEVAPVSLGELRRLVGRREDDNRYPVEGVELKKGHITKIKQWIDEALDCERYLIYLDEGTLSQDYDK